MQQRIFLSNRDLIKNATMGLTLLTHYNETPGEKPCEDYVLECKRNKSFDKLKREFVTETNRRLNIGLYSKCMVQIESCNNKEELIRFIEMKFDTLNDLNIFFNSFNK